MRHTSGVLLSPARFFMRIVGAGLLITTALLSGDCNRQPPPVPRSVVRLVRDTYVSNIGEPLAVEYARSLPSIEVRLVNAVGSVGTVEAIQRGKADLGFAFADVAYLANRRLTEHPDGSLRQVRGIAALQVTPVHLLGRPGLAIREVADLRGLTVRTGSASTGQALHAELVFRAYGLGPDSLQRRPLASSLIPDALSNGTVDAAFATAYYPAREVYAATTGGARLVPIDGPIAERLRDDYPFVRRVSIPANTYPGQHEPVRTIGVDRLLICRGDLDERLVHDLTREFLNALPRMPSFLKTSLRLMDLEQAPATPIPLHKGAAQYYRERELTW